MSREDNICSPGAGTPGLMMTSNVREESSWENHHFLAKIALWPLNSRTSQTRHLLLLGNRPDFTEIKEVLI